MNKGIDKITDLGTAISTYVTDGCHLSIGGFTINRNPMAAVYEIIRQRVRNLHVYAHSHEMYLQGYYPDASPDQILDKMGFEVDTTRAQPVPPPTERELHIMREICDPQRLIHG